LGEIQDQAGRPRGERAKVGHGLCDHRDAGFNFNFHITGIAMEACSHALDVLGCVSHNRVPLRCLRALAPTRHRKFAFHANCLPSKAVVLIGSSERGVGAKEKTTARGRTNDSTFPKATRRGLRPRRQFQRGIFSPAPTHKESTWTTRPAKLGEQAFCPHCMAQLTARDGPYTLGYELVEAPPRDPWEETQRSRSR